MAAIYLLVFLDWFSSFGFMLKIVDIFIRFILLYLKQDTDLSFFYLMKNMTRHDIHKSCWLLRENLCFMVQQI